MPAKTITALFLALTLSMGAVPAQAQGRDDFGLVLGALGGGLLGHQFGQGKGNTWATAVGAVTGAVLGQSVGGSLDRGERAYRSQNNYWSGQPSNWQSAPVYYSAPAPQVYYVSPSYETRVRTYETRPAPVNFYSYDNSINNAPRGRYCREYQAPVTVGSRTQESYGTACLQPDGSWEVVR